MVAVTDATLRAAHFENLYDILAGLTYSSSTEPGVYHAYADFDSDATFPRIIIHPVNPTSERVSLGAGNVMNRIECTIEIYAQKAKDLDIIADKIFNDFEGRTFTGVSYVGGNDNFSVNTDVNQKIHTKLLTFTFIRG